MISTSKTLNKKKTDYFWFFTKFPIESQLMAEKMLSSGISETAVIGVICHKCCQVLYEADAINPITNAVALITANGHSNAFSEPHRVSVFEGIGEAETTHEVFSTVPAKARVAVQPSGYKIS